MPTTKDQKIESGKYLSGEQTIKGDANLKAENIKSGISIFEVEGTFTDDADAEEAHIIKGKIAYVKGEKVTGTMDKITETEYVPGTEDKTYSKNQYLENNLVIKGDANLKAENIKSGVSIFGVEGTCEEDSGVSVEGTTLVLGKASISGNTLSF
jgi:hypothetical protein